MSRSIDERVVQMKFNGDQFQRGVESTNKALDALKRALNLGNAAKSMNDLDTSAKNFSLANLTNGVQDIAGKFGAMSIIGITALANIASKAVDVGLQISRSLTIDPIKAGLGEYELKMGSIQTILSNTARYGTTLPQVTGTLDELNAYADKTIYNFGSMTKNIGLFTNAGLRVEEATSMIKGFSNEAAASGTNAEGAAGAAYQLSQALSAGTIRLMDWRSLQNVGMGNKNMQNGLIEIAGAMGMLNEDTTTAADIQSNFNGSLEKNWLSADVMSSYLKIMAGDMTAAEQAQLGLTDSQIAAFATQQKMSEDAATKVRTATQLFSTMQEAAGSGWAQTFDILIGDFDQATELWTAVNDELGGMIAGQAEARNELLQGFADSGGRDKIIASISNIYRAVMNIVTPIKSAFQEMFPPVTVGNLMQIIGAVERFTKSLIPSGEQMALIKRTFMGVFAVLDIGRMVFVEIIEMFGRLFGAATEGAGGILEISAGIGDFLVKVRDAIKNGTALEKFFQTMGDIIQWPIDKLRELGQWTASVFTVDGLIKAWEGVGKVFEWLGSVLEPVGKFLGEAFGNIKDAVIGFFQTMDFNVLIGLLNVGALGLIAAGIKKLVDAITGMFSKGDGGGGMVDTIKGVFGSLTETFDQMQQTLKAGSLMAIAIAIGILTASVIALSFVDTGKLFIALSAMTIMFGQLAAMIVAIDRLTKTVNSGKMIATAIALGILAGAMVVMSAAVLIMSTMDWEELARGLSGLAVGLGLLVGASALLGKMSPRLYFAAPALLAIATAMLILSGALKVFSTMSWDDMLRAGVTLAGVLGIIVGAMSLLHSKIFAAASMVIIAVAINILAGAMKVFSTMSWDDIARSATVFAAVMAIMTLGMAAMGALGGSGVLGAAAMVIAAAAITILAGALKILATMSWEDIGQSLVVLAGGLAILAGAMALMGIPLVALGGLALAVVSAGLMLLAPALVLLGTMEWDAIGRGLTMLGASLAILAVGGLLLIPASVGFLLLGAAIMMIGAGAMMAGVGLTLFAGGLVALAAAGAGGAQALKDSLLIIISIIPEMLAAFAQGLIDFALVIAGGATEFTAAMSTLMQSLLAAINANAPGIINTLWGLIVLLVEKVVAGIPYFVDAGMRLIIGILDGINRNLPQLITSATNVIVTFLDGVSANLPRVIQSGINLIITFVEGLADGITRNASRLRTAAGKLSDAIVDGMTGGLSSRIGEAARAAADFANSALNAAKDVLGIASPSKEFFKVGAWSGEGQALGLLSMTGMVVRSAEEVGNAGLEAMRKSLSEMKSAVATDMSFNPTIKPVLDLSNVRSGAGLIGGILTPPSLAVDQNYAAASSLVAQDRAYREIEAGNEVVMAESGPREVKFEQNNYSPKPLSRVELYRQTKNVVSLAKGVLNPDD